MENPTELPSLPERLSRLRELAYDLWWSWHDEARTVFRMMDYQLWRNTAYDPALRGLDEAHANRGTWIATHYPELIERPVAYFSAEFALHQSLPIYAGGLGVLAGDHCKEASDLGLPLVGIGFMYPQGYFH